MKLGRDIKIVWIASAARCGSMWVNNVTRRIVRAAGLEVLPASVPFNDEDKTAAAEEGLRDPETSRVRVLKTHAMLRSDIPLSRFILPRRDIRDSVVSFMRFTRYDFDAAMAFAQAALNAERHYGAFPRDRTLVIDYAGIVAGPEGTVQKIAAFLEVPVDERVVGAIVDEFSKENVARLIELKEQNLEHRRRLGLPITPTDEVVIGPENVRAYDAATGFQSGHVSDYRDGDWKTILTAEQIARLDALIEEVKHPRVWKAAVKI